MKAEDIHLGGLYVYRASMSDMPVLIRVLCDRAPPSTHNRTKPTRRYVLGVTASLYELGPGLKAKWLYDDPELQQDFPPPAKLSEVLSTFKPDYDYDVALEKNRESASTWLGHHRFHLRCFGAARIVSPYNAAWIQRNEELLERERQQRRIDAERATKKSIVKEKITRRGLHKGPCNLELQRLREASTRYEVTIPKAYEAAFFDFLLTIQEP